MYEYLSLISNILEEKLYNLKEYRREIKSSVCTGNYLDIQVFAAGWIVLSDLYKPPA